MHLLYEHSIQQRLRHRPCGTAQQLGFSVRRLAQVVEQFRQVRKLGYPYAV